MLESELDRLIYNVLLSRTDTNLRINDIVSRASLEDLLMSSQIILDSEPMMLTLEFPIIIVGDIHGNIDDLLRIFEKCGYPPDKKYLFLGDYIDRGQYSIEVMILLLSLKCKFPNHINLLRGNHETKTVSKDYGFLNECIRKYDRQVYNLFFDIFSVLPIAALIDDIVFCVHGGISPQLNYLEDFCKLKKPSVINGNDIFTDLLWSDPFSNLETGYMFSPRGCGYYFSHKSLNSFLDKNNLQMLIRSHEECIDGLRWSFGEQRCLTVFSNSNYCGHWNQAMIVEITKDFKMKNEKFTPLTFNEIKKRRVIWPYWLLNQKENLSVPLSPSSSDEFIQDLIDDDDHVSIVV